MISDLSILQPVGHSFGGETLRTVIGEDGQPRFVAADALQMLTLDRKALERLEEDEKGVSSIHTLGGPQKVTVVTESGLFALILGSRKPEARAFRKWVTSEVLPEIRKNGRYSLETPALPATYAEALRTLADKVEQNERLALKVAQDAPKVEFFDTVTASTAEISLNDAAKVLGLGRNRMMKQMRADGILTAGNLPYQTYIDAGYFTVVETKFDADGATRIQMTTRVLQKGLDFLRRRYCVESLALN